MKGRIVFFFLSCLVALALLVPSSGWSKEPIYGGTINIVHNLDPPGFDPALLRYNQMEHIMLACEPPISIDWWKGPAGTNEWAFNAAWAEPPPSVKKGYLIESWELIAPGHAKYHVRPGMMWQDRPGIQAPREVTADDLVFNIKRVLANPTNYWSSNPGPPETINVLDKYTIEIKFKEPQGRVWSFMFPMFYGFAAPDVIKKFGDMTDWKHVTGTGPFILTDYVEGSSMTWKRNPNYWQKDPKGRSLPFLDGVNMLIIPDVSTRIAALRTGKVDMLSGMTPRSVGYQDALSLDKTNPQLKKRRKLMSSVMDIELDQKAPPFGPTQDPRAWKVRRAASMAIDRDGIIKRYYEGQAALCMNQIAPLYGIKALEFENLPESVQELHKYKPEKAKKLLAEAGYPKGFKTTIRCAQYQADFYSLIKAYWDAVGIQTEIKVMDSGALWGMGFGQKMTGAMGLGSGVGFFTGQYHTNKNGKPFGWNLNASKCPRCDALHDKMGPEYDWDKRVELLTEIVLIGMDEADKLYLPVPYMYNYWQPWVGGYHGEDHVSIGHHQGIATYVWIDQDLKKKMGH